MPQTPVTDTIKINTTVPDAQYAPAIAVLSGGGYIIVWQDSSADAIYGQRFNASGQPVGSELHLSNTQGGFPYWVSVAATANDGFVIAFQAGSFAQAEIFGQHYDGANNPVGGLFVVNSTSPNEQYNPHIVTLEGGTLLFTWDTRFFSGDDNLLQEVRGRIFLPDGQAFGADFPIAPMSATIEHGLSAIAPLPGGGFVVTWQSGDLNSTAFDIVGQRFSSSGEPAGAQFQVNANTANNQYGNDVARLSDGGFVVSWVDDAPGAGGGRILARHYGADSNPIGGEILIDSKASGAYGRTVVTALADGGYVVSWTEDDDANDNVLARAMGSNDVPLDAAFEMSFNTPLNTNYFSDGAVTLPNGNVVFAWDGPSVGVPGAGQDIYMRVYNFGGSTPPPVGTAGPDTLVGGDGADSLSGLGGDDYLDGGAGADTTNGGQGSDTHVVDNAGDVVIEAAGEGNDIVYASTSWTLAAGQSVETLAARDNSLTNAMNLIGNELANVIFGNNGANFIDGGAGADIMTGFGGDDVYAVDNAGDVVIEEAGRGSDTIYTTFSYQLGLGSSVEILAARDNSQAVAMNLFGNELDNFLYGNNGANFIDGGTGADTMTGFGGNDSYIVDNVGDRVVEDPGGGSDAIYTGLSYTLAAMHSIETLAARDNSQTTPLNLTGNELANTLLGNNGGNVLNGGAGADVLAGFGGADIFAFTTAAAAGNADTIADFVAGTDKLALDDAVFSGIGTAGSFNANAFVAGASAADGDDRLVYSAATGQLFYDADGNGAGAAILIATLQGNPVLGTSDFQVI